MTAATAAGNPRQAGRLAVATAAAAAVLVAVMGALSTDLGPWYASLKQPAWKPSDALFGPAWTLIYALAALAGVQAWTRTHDKPGRDGILIAFGLNAVLNVVWSLLFFRLRRPDWALSEVGLLWASIALLMVVLGRRRPSAAALLAPYLLWVAFAGVLNSEVVRLNAPFGA